MFAHTVTAAATEKLPYLHGGKTASSADKAPEYNTCNSCSLQKKECCYATSASTSSGCSFAAEHARLSELAADDMVADCQRGSSVGRGSGITTSCLKNSNGGSHHVNKMPVTKAIANSMRRQQAAHPTRSSPGEDLQSEPSHGAAAECFVQLTGGKSTLINNHFIAKPEKKVNISMSMMQLRSCSSSGGGAAEGRTAAQQVSLKVQPGTHCSSSETGKAVPQQQQQLQSSSVAVIRPPAARAEMAAAGEPAGQQQAVPQQTDASNPKSPKLVSSKSVGRSALAACASALAATVKWVDLPHRAKQKQQQQQQQQQMGNCNGNDETLRHLEAACNPQAVAVAAKGGAACTAACYGTGLTSRSPSLPLTPCTADTPPSRPVPVTGLKPSDGGAPSSSSSSSLKPRPPSGGCSPQKQRPGTVLRQASASAVAAVSSGVGSVPCSSKIAGSSRSFTAEEPHCKAAAAASGRSIGGKGGQQRRAVAMSHTALQAAAGGCSHSSAVVNIDSMAAAAAAAMAASGGGSAHAVAGSSPGTSLTPGVAAEAGPGTSRFKSQSAECVPIAVAKHCPRDLDGQHWQPSHFVTTRRLYDGKIAKVLQGHHATSGRPLALKIYSRSRLDTMERFQLAREVCLHMRSCHPHIASLYAAYKDSGHIYLLMELAPSGNLYQMLMSLQVPVGGTPRLPEQEAVVRVIGPLLSALSYLHDQGIIHRDIKLENVLLTSDGCIKLADFGLSIDTRHEVANTRLGTQGYFAPEVLVLPLKASPFEGKSPVEAAGRPCYDCKVDIWSAGVVCYEVLTGRAPFAAETVAKVVEAIQHRRLQYPGHLSSLATSFLSAALTRNPQQRPTARQLLQHPFIASHMANERT